MAYFLILSRDRLTSTTSSHSENSCKSSSSAIDVNIVKDKFYEVLDHLDTSVGKFRTEALALAKRRDFLLTCIDLLKNDEEYDKMPSVQRDQISHCDKLLNKVFIQISTIRDNLQERSLEQVNNHIDKIIGMPDAELSLRHFQMFWNSFDKKEGAQHVGPTDRDFELALFSCTIDDQRVIRERLKALIDYRTQNQKKDKNKS